MSTKTLKALLCPKCKTLSLNGWEEVIIETNFYKVKVDQLTSLEYSAPDCVNSEPIKSIHFCPGATSITKFFETENWLVEDFLVLTTWENKKLKEVKPLGSYYEEHPLPEIEEIKYNLEEFEIYLAQ